MRTIIIDCAGVSSIDDFWARYLEAAQPEGAQHFGRNLDAFRDAIEHGGPGWPGEVALAFHHAEALSELRIAGGRSLLAGLRDIASEATSVTVLLS